MSGLRSPPSRWTGSRTDCFSHFFFFKVGVGVEKEKETESNTACFQQVPRPRPGAQVKMPVLGLPSALGNLPKPGWTRRLTPTPRIRSQGAGGRASRGGGQRETATTRGKLNSFGSFSPGVWSQPGGTGPGGERRGDAKGAGAAGAYSKENPQSCQLQSCKGGRQTYPPWAPVTSI